MANRPKFKLSIEPDPCPNRMVEEGPKNEGVGSWVPEIKHLLLAKLIGGTRQARARWPRRVFIDPFCGPGRIRVKGETFTRDGGAVVACRQAMQFEVPFTQMLVGDIDEGRVLACHARLSALNAPVDKFVGPASQTIKHMVMNVAPRALTLAYIDPYNLEYLSFGIIETLASLKNVDLLVHFSTMDLNRNVDLELDDARARFDDAAPGWRNHSKAVSKSQLPTAFFSYWSELVSKLGFTFSAQQPLVRGDCNEPLYRLVFFSRHPLPNKIWDDVAKGPNLDLF